MSDAQYDLELALLEEHELKQMEDRLRARREVFVAGSDAHVAYEARLDAIRVEWMRRAMEVA